MNEHPDAFEWSLLKKSFLGFGFLLLVLYTLALLSLLVPSETHYPNGALVVVLYSSGFVLTALSIRWAAVLPLNSPFLFPLSFTSTLLSFLVSMGVLVFSASNLAIGLGTFLSSGTFYLFVLGFFSKDQRVTLAFGVVLLGIAVSLFILWPGVVFPQVVSIAEIERNLTVIVLFTVPMVTAMVVLNNRVASTVTKRARDAAEKLGHMAYFDAETDLPNGLLLERDIAEWSGGVPGTPHRLALAGFRL